VYFAVIKYVFLVQTKVFSFARPDEALTIPIFCLLIDSRELLKGPLYYACAITLATIVFWRTSPISIAVICNLCAGDGISSASFY
jgi:dolichol kinase